jgi:hypothetical protein
MKNKNNNKNKKQTRTHNKRNTLRYKLKIEFCMIFSTVWVKSAATLKTEWGSDQKFCTQVASPDPHQMVHKLKKINKKKLSGVPFNVLTGPFDAFILFLIRLYDFMIWSQYFNHQDTERTQILWSIWDGEKMVRNENKEKILKFYRK